MPFQFPKPAPYDHDHENEVTMFAKTNYRNQMRKFGIKTDDRRRHTYVIGKTGMGKSVLLENFALADIYAGHGLAFIDPHGDTAQRFLDFIPEHRIKDVVYFNPADTAFPVGFNIFETVSPDQKHLVANGLMAVFKKIWPDVWSARMEYILQNTILVLLDAPGSTLLGINRLFVDEEYRARVVGVCQDPVVKTFWLKEFAAFTEKYRTEAVAPVQNKVGQFLSASIIRNIVAQQKSTINLREIMDTRKILIVNLSKGLVGEENSRLLGAMIITRLQLAAMERVDIPNEDDRQDFYLYVDEFQNFATESFASILSEARKYRLNLIVAHQYIEQLDETVRAAIFGNVGTIITFRVGAADAMFMENEFAPTFLPEDLVNLTKYTVYLKLMINGAASEPFSATTLPPIAQKTGSRDAVIAASRNTYAKERSLIEKMVLRWSGYGTGDTGMKIETEEEAEVRTGEERMLDEIEKKNKTEMEQLARTSPDVGEAATPPPEFGQKKKKEAKYEIPCSVCGEPQKLTFEPNYDRPWYCKKHIDHKEKDAAKPKFAPRRDAPSAPPTRDFRDARPAPKPAPRRDDRPSRPALPPLGSGSVRILTGADASEDDEVPLSELLATKKKDEKDKEDARTAPPAPPLAQEERRPSVVFKDSSRPAPKPAPQREPRPQMPAIGSGQTVRISGGGSPANDAGEAERRKRKRKRNRDRDDREDRRDGGGSASWQRGANDNRPTGASSKAEAPKLDAPDRGPSQTAPSGQGSVDMKNGPDARPQQRPGPGAMNEQKPSVPPPPTPPPVSPPSGPVSRPPAPPSSGSEGSGTSSLKPGQVIRF
jgi:hypothetical protein